MPFNVASKLGELNEIKSVFMELSFKTLKAPRLCAFFPISITLIFTPFEPTSIPAYTDELLYFNLKLFCPCKKKERTTAIENRTGLNIFCMEEMFCLTE